MNRIKIYFLSFRQYAKKILLQDANDDFEITDFDHQPYIQCYLEVDYK